MLLYFSVNEVLLHVQHRLSETRTYTDPQEVVWNISQSASVQNLKEVLGQTYFMAPECVHIAKYFPQRYQWLVVEEQKQTKVSI